MMEFVDVRDLVKHFPVRSGLLGGAIAQVHAVDGVTIDIKKGETLGLVGESGCGKTTLGRTILRLTDPDSGEITIDGNNITKAKRPELKKMRREIQIIFQDPYSSINPRMTIRDVVGEPLYINGMVEKKDIDSRVEELLKTVGLNPEHMKRYPNEFSGGQRQRICIARVMGLDPKFIVLDEPTSALDVSVQAQIINMLIDLQREKNLTYMLITHDMGVVRYMSRKVAVMYLGRIVEMAEKEELFSNPMHPYTQALLSAIPIPDPKTKRKRIILSGDIPSPLKPPEGCRFHTRCGRAMDVCREEEPALKGDGHRVACWLY